ncbi:hypothetical protein HNR77_003869 [Paenibacillus sp. JGP012]|uniref:condensation domain-containing protein n=1 Tax=Paenibacillus sp. JGP012 TaxID=2735914 RepID=UPI0016138545|nr:condensation domain-containing protein [Paenibacillus sp. JGP012]MBB6022770.1 hypothetical protein [Paenibacillus sp. JGP012]
MERNNLLDILPVSPFQEAIFFNDFFGEDSDLYLEQVQFIIDEVMTYELFVETWRRIIVNNEMLRTLFRWEGMNEPVQIILKHYEGNFTFYDEPSNPKILLAERFKCKDLSCPPFHVALCVHDDNASQIIISNHHILYDGWSNSILIGEFVQTYFDLKNNAEPVPTLKSEYKTYLKHIFAFPVEEQISYWKNKLSNLENCTKYFFTDKKDPKNKNSDKIRCMYYTLSNSLKHKLDSFVKSKNVTIASVIYMSWAVVFSRYTQNKDILFGTAVSGRDIPLVGITNTIGLYINTIPLRQQLDVQSNILDHLHLIIKEVSERRKFEHFPLPEIIRAINNKSVNDLGLFDVLILVENYPIDKGVLSREKSPIHSIQSFDAKSANRLTIEFRSFIEYEVVFKIKDQGPDSKFIKLYEDFLEVMSLIIDYSQAPITILLTSNLEGEVVAYAGE